MSLMTVRWIPNATARLAAISRERIYAIFSNRTSRLAGRLAVQHNLYFYNTLMEKIREALDEGRYEEFRNTYSSRLASKLED